MGKGRIPEDRGLKGPPWPVPSGVPSRGHSGGGGSQDSKHPGEGVDTPRPQFPPFPRVTPEGSPYPGMDMGMGMGMDMDMDMAVDMGPAVAGPQ